MEKLNIKDHFLALDELVISGIVGFAMVYSGTPGKAFEMLMKVKQHDVKGESKDIFERVMKRFYEVLGKQGKIKSKL